MVPGSVNMYSSCPLGKTLSLNAVIFGGSHYSVFNKQMGGDISASNYWDVPKIQTCLAILNRKDLIMEF